MASVPHRKTDTRQPGTYPYYTQTLSFGIASIIRSSPPNAGKFAFKFLSAVRLTRAAAVDTFRP